MERLELISVSTKRVPIEQLVNNSPSLLTMQSCSFFNSYSVALGSLGENRAAIILEISFHYIELKLNKFDNTERYKQIWYSNFFEQHQLNTGILEYINLLYHRYYPKLQA